MAAPRSARPRIPASAAEFFIRIAASALVFLSSASPALAHPGRWTPPSDSWGAIAVHMALLRGDGGPFHSRVLWWQSEGSGGTLVGGQWGWKPLVGSADCSSYPDSALVALGIPNAPDNLFCSGLTQLSDGRLMVIGGTEVGTENGLKVANIFSPSSGTGQGSWSSTVDSMEYARYYPTATTLADGRVLASGGDQYPHLEFFGGTRSDTSAPTDSILRFGVALTGTWDSAVKSDSPPDWPDSLTGLSAVMSNGYGMAYYFGGRDDHDKLTNDLLTCSRDGNALGADFDYVWGQRNPPSSANRPAKRMDHAVVMRKDDTQSPEMLLFGGWAALTDTTEGATNDVWRHRWDASLPGWKWSELQISNPQAGPSARYGHTAVLDNTHDQVLVFGGRTASGATTDYSVYALRFNPNAPDSAYWFTPTNAYPGNYPLARYHHSMAMDDLTDRKYQNVALRSAVLFGGRNASGTLFNDLWRLWVSVTGDTVTWEEVEVDSLPAGRENHAASYESGTGLLFVFGGNTSGGTDNAVQAIDLDESPPKWRQYASHSYSVSGGTAILRGLVYNRVPEIYAPGTNNWSAFSSSYYLQTWYPQMFQMPNGKVFACGPALDSYTLDPATGTWAEFPASSPPDHEILGGGAVMYRPGLVMKCGSRDIEAQWSTAINRTTWIDLTSASPAWADADTMELGRVNHNVTILPNGDVIATGGLGVIRDDKNIDPRRRPEIWSATSHAWSGGAGADSLAYSQVPRGYHSTAILLPDGRILCGGGNELPGAHDVGDIYCPPYLFDSGGNLRTRPTLLSATGRWRYNAPVTFAVASGTVAASACLIHAGATTHAQDEAQRFVPLSLSSSYDDGNGHRQYFLSAPADSFIAPPGDYLFFVNDSAGVPAIAQWVRVGSSESGQLDSTAPDSMSLATEFITCDGIYPITWAAPGDDGSSGIALDYDVRYSTSPITDANFGSATRITGLPIPRLAGTIQNGDDLTSLQTCTNYYFAGKTRDKAGNWSAIGRAKYKTLCVGGSCGGLGASLSRTRDDHQIAGQSEGMAGSSTLRDPATASSQTLEQSSLRLVGEFDRGEVVRWVFHIEDFEGQSDLLETTSAGLAVQEFAGSGWQTRRSVTPHAGLMGVRALRTNGRVVFPSGTLLDAVESAPLGFACTSAVHDRLGDLLSSSPEGLSSNFEPGDTISATFAASESAEGNDCFVRVIVPEAAPSSATRRQGADSPRLPTPGNLPVSFALHSAHPNPFNGATKIGFDLPSAASVRVEVFDIQGRRVATLLNESRAAGRHFVEWNGSGDAGRRAPAGIYLCRMTADTFSAERRVTLVP